MSRLKGKDTLSLSVQMPTDLYKTVKVDSIWQERNMSAIVVEICREHYKKLKSKPNSR